MSAFGLIYQISSFLSLLFPPQPMIVIDDKSEVNGDISMRVRKAAPVIAIKVSWGEGMQEELASAN